MKKQQGLLQKGLAMLLCLCMVFSLLPTAVLAVEGENLGTGSEATTPVEPPAESPDASGDSETPAEVPETPDASEPETPDAAEPEEPEISQYASSAPEDGAIADVWEQDPATKLASGTNDAECKVENGKLFLKGGSSNQNNGNAVPPPVVFLDAKMETALGGVSGDKTLSMDVTPGATGNYICFGIYLNYGNPNGGLLIGCNNANNGAWFWQRYVPGADDYGNIANTPSMVAGTTYHLEFTWSGSTLKSFSIDNKVVLTNFDYSAVTNVVGVNDDSIGIKLGTYNKSVTTATISNVHYTNQATVPAYDLSGTVKDKDGKPLAGASVTVGGESPVITGADGVYKVQGLLAGTYDVTAALDEYQTYKGTVEVTDSDITGSDIVLQPIVIDTATLSTDTMDVIVDKAFPRVLRYEMKGDLAGKTLFGQTKALNTLTINGVNVIPTVESVVDTENNKVVYTMTAVDAVNNIDCVVHAELVADGKTLAFNITGIDNNLERLDYPVERISVPNHSLISVRSNEPGANMIANRLAGNTITSGDFRYNAEQLASASGERFIYSFIANNDLSAGIAGNSEWGTSGAGGDNWRVLATAENKGSYTSLGLSSSEWYYDRKMSSSDGAAVQNGPIAQKDSVMGPTELPLYAKVVVTGDENGDDTVNWQDSAIVARDTIVHIPYKGEEMPDIVTTRIPMNFGSQAQNPFLTTLDNIKRVALNTDGLGQAVLLKGYGSEGHDSGHPDYADIGTRMGGAEDMMTLMEEGEKYGARVGIHVNTSEFYPEAKAFTSNMIRRNDDGSLHYGWNWLDQGVGINGLYDLASGNRLARFAALKAKVLDNMDFVYVDVWGNNTSGSEDAWQTRKLSKMITDNGWRVAHEWSWANEWEVTFQHWMADYGYGSYSDKGKYNSEVERFLLNGYKDSFAPDFSHYGGSANAPLLGGVVTQGFEGWQGDSEYDQSIESIFEHMIPTKFLQHYDVMQWQDAAAPVTMLWYANSGSYPGADNHWGDGTTTTGGTYLDPLKLWEWDRTNGVYALDSYGRAKLSGGTASWTPEAQITLQDAGRADTVVVTRGSDGTVNDTYTYDVGGTDHVTGTDADRQEYRSRYITFNGKVILKGAAAPAAGSTPDSLELRELANQQYLIPWLWDKDGNELAANDQKLYHRNDVGGETTWELPDGWSTLATVKMYELTDNGRANEVTVKVENGSVTLSAEAMANYVLVKGENGAKAPTVEWSTGLHLRDVGFNSTRIEDNWTILGKGTALRYVNGDQQSVLKLNGEVSVSQTMTDLTPGQKYVTYVSVDNRSDAKAAMTVDVDGAVLASNYTEKSIAKNYISAYSLSNSHPIEGGSSYFQNMYVFFTAPASGKVTLTLSRAAGEGNTYFDDVRTLETVAENLTLDSSGSLTKFTQDFEHVAQGQYPFVVGPVEGVSDNRQHLSENHAPYTQAGWDVKKLSDVLDGNWSLKVNGLINSEGRKKLIYQTIPQNLRFEPGKTYTITFDYQMGGTGTYELVYGSGAYETATLTTIPLKKSLGTTATCKFTLVGDPSGQTWIGIRATGVDADYPANLLPPAQGQDTHGDERNFGGYKDIVLDNLSVVVSAAQRGDLAALIATASAMNQADYSGDWAAFAAALANANTVMANQMATQAKIDAAKTALDTAMKALTKKVTNVGGTVTLDSAPVANATVVLEDSAYMPITSTVTNAEGKFSFEGLSVKTYYLKVTAPGCQVQTVTVGALTAGSDATKDVALTAETAAPYVNSFDGGDVSMMQGASADATVGIAAVQHNGSGAVKISFTGDDRDKNNAVDKSIQMYNGTFSCDITMIGEGKRIGLNLRDTGGNKRVYLGQFDATNSWGWEHWNAPNSYGNGTSGVTMADGVTRHLEATITGDKVTLKVDGITVLNSSTLKATAPDWAGYVGFASNWARDIIVDNLRVTPADAPTASTYTIGGTVKDSDSKVVAGADVTVKSGETVVARTVTGLDGTYTTVALADGSYTVVFAAAGYAKSTKNVTVSGANVTDANATLTLDKEGLQNLYNQYKDKTQGVYTDESWQSLQTALTAAKAALDHPTTETIKSAFAGLNAAIRSLTEKTPDKSQLRTYYNAFNAYVNDDYTTASWTAFQTALRGASTVLNDTAAKQSQIDAACMALLEAERGLTKNSSGSTGGGSTGGSTGGQTTMNPDGSKTVTVTDKATGTVTATTTATDGTQSVVKTKTDGTVTAVVTVSDKAGDTVKLPMQPLPVGNTTVTIKTGKPTNVVIPLAENKPGVVPVLVKADGTETLMRKSVTTKDGVVMNLATSATVKLVDNSKSFTDVAANNWAHDAVAFASSRELFQGTGENTFSPALSVTRSMLVTVLYRMENEPSAKAVSFNDVASDAWYADAVGWASGTGIVTGTGGGFAPDGLLTRETLAVMLYRYAKETGVETSTAGALASDYADGATVSSWAVEAMSWAVQSGILTGKSGGKLDPAGTAGRAEVATMLMRLASILTEQ